MITYRLLATMIRSTSDEEQNQEVVLEIGDKKVKARCLKTDGDQNVTIVAEDSNSTDIYQMNTSEATAVLEEREEQFLLADGLESAFIGLGYQFHTPVAVYSKRKALEALMVQGMSELEAIEYFDYNVAGAYIGEQTPIFLEDLSI